MIFILGKEEPIGMNWLKGCIQRNPLKIDPKCFLIYDI